MSHRTRRSTATAFVAVALATVGATSASAAETVVDTSGAWDGATLIGPFGKPDTSTYGQTIVPPAGVRTLDRLTFRVKLPTTLKSRLELYAWDGTKATGPALYESGPLSTSDSDAYEDLGASLPRIPVTPGAAYVAFLTVDRDYAAIPDGTGAMAAAQTDPYPDGTFVFLNASGDSSQWTTESWDTVGAGTYDAVFRATYDVPTAGPVVPTPVPTPTPAPMPVPTPTPSVDRTAPAITGLEALRRRVRFRISEPAAMKVSVSRRTRNAAGKTVYRHSFSRTFAKTQPGIASVRLPKAVVRGDRRRFRFTVTAVDGAGNRADRRRAFRTYGRR